jgi:hypothetical protein
LVIDFEVLTVGLSNLKNFVIGQEVHYGAVIGEFFFCHFVSFIRGHTLLYRIQTTASPFGRPGLFSTTSAGLLEDRGQAAKLPSVQLVSVQG